MYLICQKILQGKIQLIFLKKILIEILLSKQIYTENRKHTGYKFTCKMLSYKPDVRMCR